MKTVNIHEAKTHLSKLIENAVNGEPFVIAKAGKPLVRVEALTDKDGKEMRRTGFLQGRFTTPADFDRMGQSEIETVFGCDS